MKNIFAIIGALLFVAAVAIGQFAKFAGADIVELGLAAFALVAVIIAIIKKQKEAKTFSWVTVLIIVITILGAALLCVGGATNSIFEQLAGVVIALIGLILGLLNITTKKLNS